MLFSLFRRNKNRTVTLSVDVRQEDINEAIRRNCVDCPVSRAIVRAIGEFPMLSKFFNEARTHILEITLPYIHHLDYWGWCFNHVSILLQSNVSQKIKLFDETGVMKPFNFTIHITVPRDALKLKTNLDRYQRKERIRYFFCHPLS